MLKKEISIDRWCLSVVKKYRIRHIRLLLSVEGGWVICNLHVELDEALRHRIERRRQAPPGTGVNGCRTGLA